MPDDVAGAVSGFLFTTDTWQAESKVAMATAIIERRISNPGLRRPTSPQQYRSQSDRKSDGYLLLRMFQKIANSWQLRINQLYGGHLLLIAKAISAALVASAALGLTHSNHPSLKPAAPPVVNIVARDFAFDSIADAPSGVCLFYPSYAADAP